MVFCQLTLSIHLKNRKKIRMGSEMIVHSLSVYSLSDVLVYIIDVCDSLPYCLNIS